ncbi:MAG: hypothetical protein AAFV53_23845, partial [Myxococcota bacterium]
DVTLVAGAEVETNVRGREGVEYMARAAHYERERGLSKFTFPHLFGRRAWAYKTAFRLDDRSTARVVEKAYRNARRNPFALHKATTVTLEDAATASRRNAEFLEDERYRPHLRMLDCTAFTDGASCILLASEAGLKRLGIPPEQCTRILAYGHTVQALGAENNPTQLTNVTDAARIAYRDAGMTPEDVQVAEVHDCFSVVELMMMEALGFCALGRADRMLADGQTEIDGRLPINTGGGLLGFGHPVGATGVKQILEIWRQMKGQAGDYQMPTPPTVGLTANLGGDDRTAVVMLHQNVH